MLLHRALSGFHPAIDLDGSEGNCSVSLALGNDGQVSDVFAVIHGFLKARPADLVVVTLA